MKTKNISSELKQACMKANMRLKACPTFPLAPEQKRKIDAADEAIRDYLDKIDKAYKLSKNSKSIVLYANKPHTR